ncbi:MAG: Uma2 family endonuclease [Candidatus Tectimicrobiota bacterium]
MTTVLNPSEPKVILRGISWDTYERLLAEHEEDSNTPCTSDSGTLEIMLLSARHDKPHRLLAFLVEVCAETLALHVENFGSTTLKHPALRKGCEPHSCFYIQHAAMMHDREEVDWTVGPPPDLIIEIAITPPSLNPWPIYAAIGVPEVWRYDGRQRHLYHLRNGDYDVRPYSLAFPPLTEVHLTGFLEARKHQASTAWVRAIRTWAQAQSPGAS